MHDVICSHNKNIPMLSVIDLNQEKRINTRFGTMPVGSVLSNHCGLIPPDFNIYYNLADQKKCNQIYVQYSLFPFKETNDKLSQYIIDLKDDQKFQFIYGLKVTSSEIEFSEASTREQANDPAGFRHRKYQFTAYLCHKIGDSSPKTPKGLKTSAQNIVHGNEKKSVLQYKLAEGLYYEPIAIKHYENYSKLSGYEVPVDRCGFVIYKNNFVLGATPDGKVVVDGEFGLLEVKCSQEYKNIDPKYICFIFTFLIQ